MTRASEVLETRAETITRIGRRVSAAGLLLSLLCAPGVAHADTAAQKRAAAQALFDEARKLVDEGRHAEACPKFRESQSLDPGIGTLYNLGACLETLGKTASAWAAFHEAADMARIAGQSKRESAARERAVALEPRLMRLAVEVPPAARVAGLEVHRDGILVGQGQWGVPVPVDPGNHRVSAVAPGKTPVEVSVDLTEEGATRAVRIGPLDDLAAPPSQPSVSETAAQPTKPAAPLRNEGDSSEDHRTLGWVLGGVGVAGLGLGTLLALDAKSKYDDSLADCDDADPDRCNADGVALRDDARTSGNYATLSLGLGAAALAGGIILVVSSPANEESSAARVEMGPVVSAGGARWMMRGAW